MERRNLKAGLQACTVTLKKNLHTFNVLFLISFDNILTLSTQIFSK